VLPLYPAEFFELGAGEVVAYVPVAALVPAAGRVSMLQIPAAELAVAVHTGTLADVDQTYGALGIYVAEREIGADGPIREQYLVTPFDTEDESGLVTEVCWPVVRAAAADPA
jgi:effector-binding domain-containing protein